MTDSTPTAIPTPAPSGQPADTQAAPALPFGVTRAQYDAALADAQARGFYDPTAPTMNEATKFESAATEASQEVTAPEQYQLHDFPVDTSDGDEAGAVDFDNWRRSALQAAGVPAEMAGGLVSACVAAEKRFANQTPDQREIQIRSANAALVRVWGDKTQENVALANKFLDYVEARQPGVIEYLDKSGAANDPAVIAAVWMQAERFLLTGGEL